MHTTPPIVDFPCIACMGAKDQYYSYGQPGLRSIYGKLQWYEHGGGHETAKEPEINDKVAAAIWRAAGWEPPSVP